MMKKLLFIFLVAFTLIACNGSDDGAKLLELVDGTTTSQTIAADKTSATVQFIAQESWKVELTAVGSDGLDWLTLSSYSGAAGTNTLTLTLKANTSEAARTAKIRITCSTASVDITVTQSGVGGVEPDPGPSGDVRLVASIRSCYIDGGKEITQYATTFTYDAEHRIIAAEIVNGDTSEVLISDKYTWEYNGSTILCKNEFIEASGNERFEDTLDLAYALNSDGTVKSMTGTSIGKYNGKERQRGKLTETYTYTNGMLTHFYESTESDSSPNDISESNWKIAWKDGNITRKTLGVRNWYMEYEYNGEYKKKCNIGVLVLVSMLDEIGLYENERTYPLDLGADSRGLVSRMTEYIDIYKYIYDYTYEYDDKGYIVKIKISRDSKEDIEITVTYKN